MAVKKQTGTLRKCKQGHRYYKTSDCPTCPICEAAKKPKADFHAGLAAPARRALENAGINTIRQLSRFTEKEILFLHGMGKSSIPVLKKKLKEAGLAFLS